MTQAAEELMRYWQETEPEAEVRSGVMLSDYTTFRVGGPAAVFAEPGTPEALGRMIGECRRREIPYFVLGRGSNVLAADRGYEGVIFHIGDRFAGIAVDGTEIIAGAGVTLSGLARAARTSGLTGLEFAGGIPGSLGGALAMNAGAYGGEMKDVVTAVRVLTDGGELTWLPASELAMGYRTSRIQREKMVALEAKMSLRQDDPEAIGARMQELAEKRRSKQPLEYPSAGSTFKRPEGYFAGKLIQDAGLSGYTVGGACVSEKHCGFVINRDHATAEDIRTVCRDVEQRVKETFGVQLEMEVRLLGFED